jgi:tetratricopeptide (TPR) repeat protein
VSAPLDVDLWRRAEQVFAAALECTPDERPRLLRQACGGDEALRAAVDTLLAFDESDFLDTPLMTPRPTSTLSLAPDGSSPGAAGSVGPYRLVALIGEGGMSRVFLAERTSPDFPQHVAVKLIREGGLGPSALRRFRRERRILAGLQHPNIARLLDGGATESGEPYVVMEYVSGLPVTRYCDERRLTVRERLELFRTICAAVQHAHVNLVIHRDIKPNNVLVTENGEPKLLDFGIATRLLPNAEEGPVTQERALTPDYASPEQLAGDPLTTASDVYSLGVVLHELLNGCRPGVTAVASADNEAVAAARAVTPRQLRRLLAGDLDHVVQRALSRDVSGRYPSVEQLSSDVGRYLAGLPVTARAPRLAYRASKFVRRNAAAVSFGLLAALCLSTLAGVFVLQSARVRRERDAARREQQRAEEVTRFLVDAFERVDPYRAAGETMTVREVLDRSAERVARSLDGEPGLQSTLMLTIGRVYTNLGLHESAAAMLEGALARRRQVHGEASVEVAEALTRLGVLQHERGDDRAAEGAFREALDIRRQRLGEEDLGVAESLAYLGYSLRDRGDYATAEPLIRQALAFRRKHLGGDHLDTASTLTQLGFLHHRKGELDRAEPLYREAVASFRRGRHEDNPAACTALANLAWLLEEKGDAASAEPIYREVLVARRRVFGDDHPEVASTLNSLAALLRNRGDYLRAEETARSAVEMNRRILPAGHPAAAAALTTLALILRDKGEPAAAEPLLRESLDISRRALGPDDPDVSTHLLNLATVLLDSRQYSAAERALEETLARRRRQLGPRHWQVANTMAYLAEVKRATGRAREAHTLATEAVDILAAALPATHWRTAQARSVLGDCLVALGDLEAAGPLLTESAAVLRAAQGSGGYAARRAQERLLRYEAARRTTAAAVSR